MSIYSSKSIQRNWNQQIADHIEQTQLNKRAIDSLILNKLTQILLVSKSQGSPLLSRNIPTEPRQAANIVKKHINVIMRKSGEKSCNVESFESEADFWDSETRTSLSDRASSSVKGVLVCVIKRFSTALPSSYFSALDYRFYVLIDVESSNVTRQFLFLRKWK